MPATPLNFFDDEELLPLDNVLEFLKIAIDEGVKKIRITGRESLLHKGLDEFIAKLHDYNKEVALVLSTNGFLLKKMAIGFKKCRAIPSECFIGFFKKGFKNLSKRRS